MLIKTTKLCTLLGIGAVSFLQAQQLTPVTLGPKDPDDAHILSRLQGPKVKLANATLNYGNRLQFRTFENGKAAGFEMDKGVIVATTLAHQTMDPNKKIWDILDKERNDEIKKTDIELDVSKDLVNTNNVQPKEYKDPDLIDLEPEAIYDVVSYEFDVTLAETATALNVSYQFGSEEYPYYVGSQFNDAFGFFVSGPGIDTNTPGNVNGKLNMAKFNNGGVTAITSVNTINDGVYGAYSNPDDDGEYPGRPIDDKNTNLFINNGYDAGEVHPTGSTVVSQAYRRVGTRYRYVDLYNTLGPAYKLEWDFVETEITGTPKIHTVFNGVTKMVHYSLTGLQPGGTYRFKIVIGDAGDAQVNSGVLISNIDAFLDIQAQNDSYTLPAGGSSTDPILANDIYRGYFDNSSAVLKEKPLERSMVTISAPSNIVKVEANGTRTASSGFTFDSNGKIKVASSVAEGTYEFDYTICDATAPNYCSTAKVTVVVEGKVDTPPSTDQCIKPSQYSGTGTATKVGISTIGQPNAGWPENIPNGHIVMTSKEKGFAITQVANVSAIATPVEGMLVYDLTDKCVKLYDGTAWKCIEKLTECE